MINQLYDSAKGPQKDVYTFLSVNDMAAFLTSEASKEEIIILLSYCQVIYCGGSNAI